MRRALAALACAFSFLAHGSTAATTDYSDLWWNSAESGWGAHVTLQDDVVFMVLFVYDAGRQARFLVAPDMRRSAADAGSDVFEGALFATTGPAFAGAFDPSSVATREVGRASLRFDGAQSGQLAYSVDGAPVTKTITRQSWRLPDLAGIYQGGLFAVATGAASCLGGHLSIAYPGTLTVTQSGDAVTIDSVFDPGFAEQGRCRMTGRLVPQGSLAAITQGAYACEFFEESNRVSGTFEITGLRAGESGLGGRYVGREGTSCVQTGRIGGVRRGYAVLPQQPDPEQD